MVKTIRYILNLLLCLSITTRMMPVSALESEDYSNTTYWNGLCVGAQNLSESEQTGCAAYADYLQKQNTELQNKITSNDSKKSQVAEEALKYSGNLEQVNAKISDLNGMVDDLSVQLDGAQVHQEEIEKQMEANKIAVAKKKVEIEALQAQVSDRMAQQQETMRVNKFVDILLGASSFADFIRIANGLADIYNYDARTLNELNESLDELNAMQKQLESNQKELDELVKNLENGQDVLELQQSELEKSQKEAENVQKAYDEQLAGMDEASVKLLHQIEDNRASITAIETSISISKINEAAAASTPAPQKTDSPQSASEPTTAPTVTTEPEETASPQETPAEKPEPTTAPEPEETPEPTATPEPEKEEESWTTPQTGGGSNPYYGGWSNCVWGAWQLVYDNLGIALPGWGYSTYWIQDAQASGYPTGSEPRVNSIAVYEGHVAFVTAVDGDMVYIKEGNYLGSYYERWVSKDMLPYTNQACLGYIYLN